MALIQPIVKQTSWFSLIPQLLILSAFIALASLTGTENPAVMGSLAYISVSVVTRRTATLHHRIGMAHLRKEELAPALERFKQSYDFFSRSRWVDNWRYVTLMSSSRISYQEMALLNIAYCYGQLGEEAMAKEFYQKTLHQFPDSAMAKAAIKMLDSVGSGSP